MVPALKAALVDPRPEDRRFLRQVVFLTDGEIGNEQELLDELTARRGRSRVFMVGIGSAPNTYLMTRAAEMGRGTFTHIGSPEEVEADMRELFDKLQSPVATELKAEFAGVRGEGVTPAMLPDVYAGEPVVLAAKVSGLTGSLRIGGRVDGRWWSAELPLERAVAGQGISQLWARRQITDVEVARTLGQIDWETGDARILKLALDHHLVTSLTSLVAVDRTPKRPAGVPLTREEIPIDLPAGWDFDHIFGSPAQRAEQAQAELEQVVDAVDLGQGGTDAALRMLLGLLLLLSALALFVLRPGRREVRA
jgi:Ca-activated chloride channel homolog